jgi:hypothetical protein
MNLRMLTLFTAATLAASLAATGSFAQSAGAAALPPADLNPTAKIYVDTLRSRLAPSSLGLQPRSAATEGSDLPYGLSYSGDTKSVMMPLDQKNEWGVGLNLNVNSPPTVELAPSSSLGLQPKRTPGVMLQRRF